MVNKVLFDGEKYMKVCVIVPVYNAERYIEQCFNSIVEQTYKNVTAVFVDDCSTDDSKEIIHKLIRKTMLSQGFAYKLIEHESNKNVSAARNAGIEYALGADVNADFVMFMDSDDMLAVDGIDKLMNLADKYPSAQIVNGAVIPVGENVWDELFPQVVTSQNWGEIYSFILGLLSDKPNLDAIEGDAAYFDKRQAVRWWFANSLGPKGAIVPCGVWATLYKCDFIKEYGLRFASDLPVTQDVFFRYSCFKNADGAVVSREKVYIYRSRTEGSLSTHSDQCKRIDCSARVLEKMLPDIDDKEYSLELAKWGIEWVKGWLGRMKSEKEKALMPKYFNILSEINEKIKRKS